MTVKRGLRSVRGAAAPPYGHGPYTWDQQVTFSGGVSGVNSGGDAYYVDGTNGSDGNNGKGWASAMATIQAAVDLCGKNDTVYIAPKEMTALTTDPSSYTENVVIGSDNAGMALIGVCRGRTQGGLPQIKVGTTTTSPILTIKAPGCLIANLGINGNGGTGGGILLKDDDGVTGTAFGTTIVDCHFKNCVGTNALSAATGGAIMWSADGGAWQVLIAGNRFYKNVGDIVMMGTGKSVPQDVIIEDNVFGGPADAVDCNIYVANDGINGLIIRNNDFQALPTLSSGVTARFVRLTTSVGIMCGNRFGCTGKTFAASTQTGGLVPTTVFMCDNYQADADTQIKR